VALPEVPEWPQPERLQYEKEALGFYISGHPLAELAEELARAGALRTTAVAELEDGAPACLGGLVAACKPYVDKKGETMAFLSLEDMYGTAEVIVFPDLYRASAGLLQGEEPLIVWGRVSKDEKAAKLVAERLTPLRGEVELRIRLEAGRLLRSHLEGLKELLLTRPGSRAVILEWLEDGGRQVAVPADIAVEEGADLAHLINGLLGYPAAT
jgi:DNA polymerase-3 subunit alpha